MINDILPPTNNRDPGMSIPQKRAIADLFRNASSRGLNYSERGFRQKFIDLLFKLGYYNNNKTIYFDEKGSE